jgi:hypothetical protein
MQEEQQERAQADHAPGGEDLVDPTLVIGGFRVEVVEDNGEDQEGPAEEPGQPLVPQIDQAFRGIQGAAPALARSIAGGHCR